MPGRKTRQTTIGGPGFSGNLPLTLDDVKRLEISKVDDIPGKLLQNWSGGIVGLVCLSLSNDNRRVQNGNFVLLGNFLDVSKSFSASTYWDVPAGIALVLKDVDCKVFKFGDSLSSDLVDSEDFDFHFTRDGTEITDEEEEHLGLHGFAIRAFIAPLSGERAKLSLVLFPRSAASLEETLPLSSRAAFPGISLTSAEFNFAPLASAFLSTNHGMPFFPALLPSQPFSSLPNFPSLLELKAAVTGVLRKLTKPECKKNHTTLLPRWEELISEGEVALKELTPDLLWPLPKDAPSPPLGRVNLFDRFSLSYLFHGLFLSSSLKCFSKTGLIFLNLLVQREPLVNFCLTLT